MGGSFDEHVQAWTAYTATPWGRIRYAVVREALRASLEGLGEGLRVLDVGGGDGQDSRPLADAGHEVTLLDPSEAMLAAAPPHPRVVTKVGGIEDVPALGEYDVVLCHFVLKYLPDPLAPLDALAAAVRPGGVLSIVDSNPDGLVLQKLVRQGPAAALEELDRPEAHTVTFERAVGKVRLEAVEERLATLGLTPTALYGGRIANDLLTDDDLKQDPDYYADLERLEIELSGREPFNRMGQFWQLVLR